MTKTSVLVSGDSTNSKRRIRTKEIEESQKKSMRFLADHIDQSTIKCC